MPLVLALVLDAARLLRAAAPIKKKRREGLREDPDDHTS